MDCPFRVLTGSIADFASDLNAMMVANGFPGAMPAGWAGEGVVIDDITRLDFDTFQLPSGLHVNARLTILPGADPATAAQVSAFWPAAISAWFGQGGSPGCPTLATFTNPAPTAYPSNGGQQWPSTGNTALISPAPTAQKRVWA